MPSGKLVKDKSGLGTSAVFLTAISTILGAIMFLRFGWAVGSLGFNMSVLLIVLGHIVTIPTAMAIAEIATNQKVEGGGEYYIISRSFGINIGGTIGIALYLSQAVSVAFYIIAFAQAFEPIRYYVIQEWGYYFDMRIITFPMLGLLLLLMLKKGADLGVKALYVVVGILFVSLLLFFLGSPTQEYTDKITGFEFNNNVLGDNKEIGFFTVFAICFPGFTGMTAGVGLSGDLKNPSKAIPLGTLMATIVGMIVYIAIVYKLAASATPSELYKEELIMSDIALWGPIIPIGLAAATLSSALGSIMVAPRTLQAIAGDSIFPANRVNKYLARGKAKTNEPINATIITAVVGFGILLIGEVDLVAKIISMFFMVTYGALCLISFLEHFAADPAYRPSFRSKWYFSLIGAVMCFGLMFQMEPGYALVAVIVMVVLFVIITHFNKGDNKGLATIFQGVIFQLSRKLQVFVQKVEKDTSSDNWRPSVVTVSEDSFERFAAFDMLRWISHKYGFGTYIHRIENYLSKESNTEAKTCLKRLIKHAEHTGGNIYLDTLVSPSFTAAISQVLQLPGISGKENNMIMFEFPKDNPKKLTDILDNFPLVKSSDFDVAILASSVKAFGFKRSIHIWITSTDVQNANLMILMGYIIMGHPEWKKANIKILTLFPTEELQTEKDKLLALIASGRIPISPNNIELIPKAADVDHKSIVNDRSKDADLTIIGFRSERVKHDGMDVFTGYDNIGDILYVNTDHKKEIK